MAFWDLFFPVERGISMAAFIGTTVLLLNGKKRDKSTMITTVIGNYLMAVYLTELIAEMSNLKQLEGIAFAIGVGGFKLVERTIDQVFTRISNNLTNDGSTGEPDSTAQ